MPLPGFTEQEERECRSLGLQLVRAYLKWKLGLNISPPPEDLGDFWVVQAKAILDYMKQSAEDRARKRFGPTSEDLGGPAE